MAWLCMEVYSRGEDTRFYADPSDRSFIVIYTKENTQQVTYKL
jgi:hypothetical protein